MAPTEYDGRRATLIDYLKVKCDQADWHGVSDAANDLRVLEAEHQAESQRTLGKYAPIIEQLRAKQHAQPVERRFIACICVDRAVPNAEGWCQACGGQCACEPI